MNPSESNQLDILNEISEDTKHTKKNIKDITTNLQILSENWFTEILSILGNISAQIRSFQKHEKITSENFPDAYMFDNVQGIIKNLLLLGSTSLQQTNKILSRITGITEEQLLDLLTCKKILLSYQTNQKSINANIHDLIQLLDLNGYSFCPNCSTIEYTLDFQLCDKCHGKLLKGPDIFAFFEEEYLSTSIPLPKMIINSLQQRFTANVRQITYNNNDERKIKQLIEIPSGVHFNPDHNYNFFVVPAEYTLKIDDSAYNSSENLIDNPKANQSETLNQPQESTCRNCGSKLQFLRTTMYYETTCDLYKCPNCGMEKMTNFQSIWDSGFEDKD